MILILKNVELNHLMIIIRLFFFILKKTKKLYNYNIINKHMKSMTELN
jgi:hypothetical protein